MTRVSTGRARGLLRAFALVPSVLAAAACASPLPSHAGSCEPPGWTPVVDEAHGYSICLPGHWRDLRAGDPGFVEIYDEPNSVTEVRVASGNITRFAVPLVPRDADLVVNLTVYVTDNHAARTSAEAGAAYVEAARGDGATELVLSAVTLPVGEATEMTGLAPNDMTEVETTDWVDAFVIATPDAIYYLLFSAIASRSAPTRRRSSATRRPSRCCRPTEDRARRRPDRGRRFPNQ